MQHQNVELTMKGLQWGRKGVVNWIRPSNGARRVVGVISFGQIWVESHGHICTYLDPTPSMVSSVTFIDYPYGEYIGLIDFMIWSVEIIV